MAMKVSIRPFVEADAPALSALIAESLAELRPWMAWASAEPQSLDERRSYLRSMILSEASGSDRIRAILVDDEIAGSLGLHRNIGPNAWEIGYWLATDHTGAGITTTAVRLLCAEAFSDPATTHLEIHHASSNTASAAVALRAGFTHTTSIPRTKLAPNDSTTEHIWHLTRTDWVQLARSE
jgi:RimJ/RimL family protein N-acetyltransferase